MPPADAAQEVAPDTARQALRAALDAWQAGKKPDELRQGSPPITVNDYDWATGRALAGYELVGDGVAEGSNLQVESGCP